MGKKGKKKGGSGGGEGPSGGDGNSEKQEQKVQQPPKPKATTSVPPPSQPSQPSPAGVWGRGQPRDDPEGRGANQGGRDGGGSGGHRGGRGGGSGDHRGGHGGGSGDHRGGHGGGSGDHRGSRGGGSGDQRGGRGGSGDHRGGRGGGSGDHRGGRGGGSGDHRGGRGGGPGDHRGGRGGGSGDHRGGRGGGSGDQGGRDFPGLAPPAAAPASVWGRPQTAPLPTSDPGPRPQTAYVQQGQPRPVTVPTERVKSEQKNVSSSSSSRSPSIPTSSSSSSISGSSPQRSGDDLGRKMSDLSLACMPKRKATGSYGRPITIETNHFALKFLNPNIVIYHYDVDIKPEKPYRLYRKVVNEFQRTYYPNNFFGFDGKKNIFTNIKMKTETVGDVHIFDDEKSSDHKGFDYTIVVKYAHEFTLKKLWEYFESGSSLNPPQLMIQALDVVLRRAACENPRFVSVGRSFFSAPKDNIVSLTGGLNLWYGFYQSAILGWKPFLNVDVAHKGFPEAVNCIDSLCNLTNVNIKQELDQTSMQIFRQYIKGLKVIYEIPNQKHSRRTYRITDIADPPNKKKFIDEKEKNHETTVYEYFRKKKNYVLQYPHLPSLQAGAKTADRDCCLPLELCTIMEGQVVNKKLNEKQTAAMVKSAARPTHERKRKIMNAVHEVNFNSDQCVSQFGISVNSEFEKVAARVVPPPLLQYDQQKKTEVGEGVWNPGKFIKPYNVQDWAIVNLDFRTNDATLKGIGEQFRTHGRMLGMDVTTPEIRVVQLKRHITDIRPALQREFDELKKKNVRLIVVVIPSFGDIYGQVKQVAELRTGILTQCLKSKTVSYLNRSTVTNILLKLNAKLNGLNHSLSINEVRFNFLEKPIIIFGADVTHPSPDQTDIPSVAAVTASFDRYAFKYNVEWAIQGARDEIIGTLEDIVVMHLKHFYGCNKGFKPQAIVFYRDGVSEGQFDKVLRSEVQAIKRACKKLEASYEPPITFLVVQKRHHTRLFPVKPQDARGKNMNVPAGTVVDQTITHPTEKDFYLNSHASIQGTSRPSKYHVLWDDADRSMDYLQVMTYYLCHLFTRCTRSISYPAPTYYAHLAAFRIRAYCEGRSMSLQEFNRDPRLKEIQKTLSKEFPMFFV